MKLHIPTFGLDRIRAKLAKRRAVRVANKEKKKQCPSWSSGIYKSSSTTSMQCLNGSESEQTETTRRTSITQAATISSIPGAFYTISDMLRKHLDKNTSPEKLTVPTEQSLEIDKIELDLLEPAWFRRRESSLIRAAINFLGLFQYHRYDLLVMQNGGVTSHGIEMEMNDSSGVETNEYDSDDSLMLNSFLQVHNANSTHFGHGASNRDSLTKVSEASNSNTNSDDTVAQNHQTQMTFDCRPRPRPVPLSLYTEDLANTNWQFAIRDRFCVISETPLTLRVSQCSTDTPITPCFSLRLETAHPSNSRPGTAHTFDSESLMLDGW